MDEVINDVVSIKGKKDGGNVKVDIDTHKVTDTVAVVTKSPDKGQPINGHANATTVASNPAVVKPAVLPPDIPDVLRNKIATLIEVRGLNDLGMIIDYRCRWRGAARTTA